MRHIILTGISALFLFVGCERDPDPHIDCDMLIAGINEENLHKVKNEIEGLTGDLHPVKTPEDQIGHQANLQILVDRLNEKCSRITASIICYACIYTYPATSEVLIEYTENGEPKEIVIDLFTPENDFLRFRDMHPNIQ